MTTELVTAHAGKNHVGSEDVGALYAGALGSGRFAFDVGEGLAVTMTDANTVRIGTGVFLMDGRQVRVKEAESVKVANGSQGAFRRDLVTYTYKRDPSNGNVEEGTWSVLQGTAAAKKEEAKAPGYTAGNILDGDLTATVAVAEVSLSGLTPTARLLLPSVASLRTLGDSVSNDGGEQPFAGGYLYRFGPLRVLQIQNMTLQANVPRTVGKLPAKPTREVVGAISYDTLAGYVSIHTDGTVICMARAGGDFSGQVSFLVG